MSFTSAARLKDEGNKLFGQRQLDLAVRAYSRALCALQLAEERLKQQSQPYQQPDLLLLAVITSNRSACYFELGDFNHAAIDASTCIDNIEGLLRLQHKFEHTKAHTPILAPADEAKAIKIRDSAQWRRTRALLYQHEGDLHEAQKRLDDLSFRGGGKKEDDGEEHSIKQQQQNCQIPGLPNMDTKAPLLPRKLTPREAIQTNCRNETTV